MAELATYRASMVGSEEILYFVKVPTDVETWDTKAFHMDLLMAESNAADSGVTTEDPPDVTAKVAGHAVTGYKKSLTHSGPFLKGEPVCEFLRYLYDHDVVDERTSVEIIRMYTWNKQAFKATATCEVTAGIGGDAQGKAQVAATFTYTSEDEEGTASYDKDTGVATFTPKAQG